MRHMILIASCLALGLATATAHAAAPADLAGEWQGQYFYPTGQDGSTQPPVPFTARIEITGTTVSGNTVEPNTFGDRSAAQLRATLTGVVTASGRLQFNKRYDGTGGVNHSVAYAGTIDASGTRVNGNWVTDGGYSGQFEMWQTHRAVQAGCLTAGSGYVDGSFFKVPFTNRCDRPVWVAQCAIHVDGTKNRHDAEVPARGEVTMTLGNVPPITSAPWNENRADPCR